MKSYLLSVVFLLPASAHAQVGTAKWKFQSRSDLVSALQKTRGKLRPTYEVLVCAARQGYTNTSLNYYARVVQGRELEATAQDSAAYAFAFDLAGFTFRPWNWKRDTTPRSTRANLVQALTFRDRALELLPNSPEVLVMRSFYEATNEKEQGYKDALKATRHASRWADAYYWLSHAAIMYGSSFPPNASKRAVEVRMGKLALSSARTAQRLDNGLRRQLLLLDLIGYNLVGDKQSATMIPVVLESHLKAFPDYATWCQGHNHETLTQLRQRWARRVQQIKESQN